MSLLARDTASLSRLQKLRFNPAAVTGGRGSRLTLEDGREVIDFSAGWASSLLGYGHPTVAAALARVAANPAGSGLISVVSSPAVELAEALLALFPGDGDRRVWLGHSASDANETMVRALSAATGRKRFLTFAGSWHGGTMGAMAVSGHPALLADARSPGLGLVPYPDAYRDPANIADRTIEALKRQLSSEGQDFAAFFMEPIQSDGGIHVPPPGFLGALAALCRRHGILVVCDEAKVGLGRTGSFHAFTQDGFEPDILVLGKGLGGGLPIGAAIGPASVMDFASGFALQTLHGNPFCASAALAVLETIAQEGLVDRAHKAGARLRAGLEALALKHALIGDVRGRGLVLGVELVTDRLQKTPAKLATLRLVNRALALGVLLYYVGPHGNVLEFTPALTIADADIDGGLERLDQAFADIAAGMISDEEVADYAAW
jgi:4-aminobutyrate aminotransferase